MSFFKHVGTVNSKKAIIVQRQLSGDESHMAVVIYSEIMPSKYHDDVMQILESEQGQAAFEFRDVLQRRMMADGQNMLEALSGEGYLKRVAANNVMVTPNAKSSMRLDELNKLLNEVGRGDEAVKRLDRMENAQGIADPARAEVSNETVKLNDMGVDLAAETAKSNAIAASIPVAPVADQNALMMQMMQTMQAMQQQINEMRGSTAPAPKSKAAPKAKTAPKTKTAARA
jgi:hypothetical protein